MLRPNARLERSASQPKLKRRTYISVARAQQRANSSRLKAVEPTMHLMWVKAHNS